MTTQSAYQPPLVEEEAGGLAMLPPLLELDAAL